MSGSDILQTKGHPMTPRVATLHDLTVEELRAVLTGGLDADTLSEAVERLRAASAAAASEPDATELQRERDAWHEQGSAQLATVDHVSPPL